MYECGPWQVQSTSSIIWNAFTFSQGGVLLWQPKRETLSFWIIMELLWKLPWICRAAESCNDGWTPLRPKSPLAVRVCVYYFFVQMEITNTDSPHLLVTEHVFGEFYAQPEWINRKK